jgi:hypothetical protein
MQINDFLKKINPRTMQINEFLKKINPRTREEGRKVHSATLGKGRGGEEKDPLCLELEAQGPFIPGRVHFPSWEGGGAKGERGTTRNNDLLKKMSRENKNQ